MNRLYYLLLYFFCVLLFLDCTPSDEKLAGPSTEEGNPVILGKVFYNSKPSADAVIRAHRIPDITDSSSFIPGQNLVAVTYTDKKGVFSFYELVPGTYSLEAYNPANQGYGLADAVILSSDSGDVYRVDSIALMQPGRLTGVVTRGGVLGIGSNVNLHNGFIQVKLLEIDREYTTGPDGKYELNNIPAGEYTLAFYASDGFFTQFHGPVQVTSGGSRDINPITLERIPWLAPPKPTGLSARYNSPAGTVTLSWHPVLIENLAGYKVERRSSPLSEGILFGTTDTTFEDTLSGYPQGTVFYYVVRAVNNSFMESSNDGPVKIIIP